MRTLDDQNASDAFKVGVLLCVGVIVAGIGRPEAVMIGGLSLGMSRQAATEFGTLLSIPTIALVVVAGLFDGADPPMVNDLPMFFVGAACSFVCAWASVEWLLRVVVATSYVPLAWYRFACGFVVLATLVSGIVKWSDA